ncbi:MAG: hypothetical protein AAF844_10010 [Pseudomonadota bacterium]
MTLLSWIGHPDVSTAPEPWRDDGGATDVKAVGPTAMLERLLGVRAARENTHEQGSAKAAFVAQSRPTIDGACGADAGIDPVILHAHGSSTGCMAHSRME